MIINNLSALKINKLTKEQYDRLLEDGLVKEDELYLIPDLVNAIPAPEAAKVGQVLSVASIDENGKPESWETINISQKWRYIGRTETTEDVMSMTITVDTEGNPFRLSKVIIQGLAAPNNSDVDGYIKPTINGAWWSIQACNGCKNDGTNIGRAFRQEIEVVDGKVMGRLSLVSANLSGMHYLLQTKNAVDVDTINNTLEADYIHTVGMTGWQRGIFGPGSYIDVWGVDA